jgi:hypothetical protein
MPGGPPVPAGPAPKPERPANEGLINRVLGLISGETKEKERREHEQALQQAMKLGAEQAMQGIASQLMGGMGGGDPTSQIRGLMAQAGPSGAEMPPAGPEEAMGAPPGLARGGYPDLIAMQEPPGLPIRSPVFSSGGNNRFVPPNGQNGRSDKVEARLSPNEYVVDAETMSMLGDGSPDAGADKMDKFRANVRRHKGQALAKGKFSPNARKPESYLS